MPQQNLMQWSDDVRYLQEMKTKMNRRAREWVQKFSRRAENNPSVSEAEVTQAENSVPITNSSETTKSDDYAQSSTLTLNQAATASPTEAAGFTSVETKRIVEQLIGHLTALGILQAQRIAREASSAPNPREYLQLEQARAVEVMRAAMVNAPGLDNNAIRSKALAVVTQTFENIRIKDTAEQTDPLDLASNRTVN